MEFIEREDFPGAFKFCSRISTTFREPSGCVRVVQHPLKERRFGIFIDPKIDFQFTNDRTQFLANVTGAGLLPFIGERRFMIAPSLASPLRTLTRIIIHFGGLLDRFPHRLQDGGRFLYGPLVQLPALKDLWIFSTFTSPENSLQDFVKVDLSDVKKNLRNPPPALAYLFRKQDSLELFQKQGLLLGVHLAFIFSKDFINEFTEDPRMTLEREVGKEEWNWKFKSLE